jgi:Tfp pilus assembly protein PilO
MKDWWDNRSAREKVLVVLLVVTLLGTSYTLLLLTPRMANLSRLKGDITAAAKHVQKLVEEEKGREQVLADITTLTERMKQLLDSSAGLAGEPDVINSLVFQADEAGMTVTSLKFSREDESVYRVTFAGTGTYDEARSFLNSIEDMAPTMGVASYSLTPGGERLTISMEILAAVPAGAGVPGPAAPEVTNPFTAPQSSTDLQP